MCVGDLRVIAKAGKNAANLLNEEHHAKDDHCVGRVLVREAGMGLGEVLHPAAMGRDDHERE
jgi:hypothetical protein